MGPHYWFFLHTVAENYPSSPTNITKRKYYDLIQNFPLFIPVEKIGNKFSQLLDIYPVTPYLDSRESFIEWVHFIHNKINAILHKKQLSLQNSRAVYNNSYKKKQQQIKKTIKINKETVITFFILSFMVFVILNI